MRKVLILARRELAGHFYSPMAYVIGAIVLGVTGVIFFFGFEPRFKMRYGTYLSAERWRRVLLHLSGTVGSPLAFWRVALRTEEALPGASATCRALFLLLVAVQVLTFSLGIAGVRRLGPLGAVRHTSGGAAAYELREAMTKNGMEPDSV